MVKNLLFFTFALWLLSLGGLIVVIYNINPFTASAENILLSYATLCVFLATLYTLAFCRRSPINSIHILKSLRQGIILGFILCVYIYFNSEKLLNVWNILPVLTAGFLIEVYFNAEKKKI